MRMPLKVVSFPASRGMAHQACEMRAEGLAGGKLT